MLISFVPRLQPRGRVPRQNQCNRGLYQILSPHL
jgi:hypothetical protein